MLGTPTVDRKVRRHEATKAEIVAAAWDLAEEAGIGGISLRDLAGRVGLRAPSLYEYFPSKLAIYDAMYADGWTRFRELMESLPRHRDLRAELRQWFGALARHWVSRPAQFSLMCQRPVPGFEPSVEAYAIATGVVEQAASEVARHGVTDPRAVELLMALQTGLVAQQIANQPGGERWLSLCDEAIDMFLHWTDRQREAKR